MNKKEALGSSMQIIVIQLITAQILELKGIEMSVEWVVIVLGVSMCFDLGGKLRRGEL